MTSTLPRVRWRGCLGLLASALVGVVLALAPASPAAAHASLVRTDPTEGQVLPESPGVARLTFDETVSVPAGGVQLFDADGDVVSSEASARDAVLIVDLPETLADGSYVVSWRVVSADGHPVAGALTFSVGQPSAVVTPPSSPNETSSSSVRGALSAVQGAGYLGLFLGAGLLVFAAWLLPPLPRLDVLRRRLARVAQASAAVAVLAGLLQLPLSGAYQQGLDLVDVLSAAAWSGAWGRELLALLLLAGGLGPAVALLGDRPLSGAGRVVGTVGAAVALVSPSLVGHSRAFPPQVLVILTDALHLAVGAVWLGGLVGLAMSLPALAGRARAAAETLGRFSSFAAVLLAVLVAAGAVLAWRIVGSWEDLFSTNYGRLLIVKVTIAALAIGIAAWNRYALLPRILAATGNTERREAATEIRRTVGAEASVLVAVLLVTGFLVNQSPRTTPPAIEANRTGVVTGQLGEDLRVLATLSPRARGKNSLTIQLQDLAGEPVEQPRPPTVRVSSDAVDLGDVRLARSDAGTFSGETVIPTGGTWRVQVSLRLDEFENPVASLSFRIPGA